MSIRSKTAAAVLFAAVAAGGIGWGGSEWGSSLAFGEDAPAPAPATKPGARWTLTMTHSHLKRVVVEEKTYYYMTLDVTNNTGLPRPWRPLIVGKTDTLRPPYVAGGFAPAVAEIRRLEGTPELQPVEQSGWQAGEEGKIKVGEKKRVVALFGPIDAHWSKFRVEVSGLVNPKTTIKVNKYPDGPGGKARYTAFDTAYEDRNDKVLKELKEEAAKSGGTVPAPTPEYREIVEDRAFVMVFGRSGDEFHPDDDPIRFVSERWEILGEPKVVRVIASKV
jgi:hypothetical protein